MRGLLLGVLLCFFLHSTMLRAETPGEVVVTEAIQSLKKERAALKEKADRDLLDAAIEDLEERLTQVGTDQPEPEEQQGDGPFVMPKNWELKFSTGRNRPSYNKKSGELKLLYDFADAKQLKDFECAGGVKPAIQKGVLTVKGGSELKHIASFKTLSVSCTFICGHEGNPIQTTEGHALRIKTTGHYFKGQTFGVVILEGGKEIGFKNLDLGYLEDEVPIPLKTWHVGASTMSLEIGRVELGGKIAEGNAGHVRLVAEGAPTRYSKMSISGVIDPQWAEEFFSNDE
jgi:hypothetical protein